MTSRMRKIVPPLKVKHLGDLRNYRNRAPFLSDPSVHDFHTLDHMLASVAKLHRLAVKDEGEVMVRALVKANECPAWVNFPDIHLDRLRVPLWHPLEPDGFPSELWNAVLCHFNLRISALCITSFVLEQSSHLQGHEHPHLEHFLPKELA